MDGVLLKDVHFWLELHKEFGTYEQGKELTAKYLHTNYDKLVEEVVAKLWKGKDAKAYFELVNKLEYMVGIKELFKKIKEKHYVTVIISASSIDVARRVQKDYGIDNIYANELVIKNNKVSGEFMWPIGAGKEKKAEIIKHLCTDLGIKLEEVIYVGDSETDIEAFKVVGKSIAFNCKNQETKENADVVVESEDLRELIVHLD